MTASLALTKRKQMGNIWNIKNFSYPTDTLGGWESHYITQGGGVTQCHPDFYAIPIGSPDGFLMCVKREDRREVLPPEPQCDVPTQILHGVKTGDLYSPWRRTPIQLNNPTPYFDRLYPPNNQELIRDDYIKLPPQYNREGMVPRGTTGNVYFDYNYPPPSRDKIYPPYKYDVTRLVQPYPVWKNAQVYNSQIYNYPLPDLDKLDQSYDTQNPGW